MKRGYVNSLGYIFGRDEILIEVSWNFGLSCFVSFKSYILRKILKIRVSLKESI